MAETNNNIDVNDPHFIHQSETPGGKLVANVFSGSGYGGWRRSMLIALSAKNKIGFIDGSIHKPATNAPTAKSWQRCNDVVFSWILSSVSPTIADSIIFNNTAKDAWDELQERFGQSNGAQLYSVQK
ncbi:uncharacterized protein LOC141649912 [Silene latifolia]|uniref:uncharacterized protein LOC141649912 n=1 Tax=Silene latifolia TaxID=37657 RepID=UPI003D77EDE2